MRLKVGVDLDGKIYGGKHTAQSSMKDKAHDEAF